MLFCQKFRFFIFFFLFLFIVVNFSFAKTIKYAYVKYSKINLREGPSTKTKIISKLIKNTKVQILKKSPDFYYVLVLYNNLKGWIYSRGLYKFETIKLPDYNVTYEFNALNKNARSKILEFKNSLNFDFYKKDVKIIFSYEPKFNIGRVFIETEFNKEYYIETREPSLKSNQIDLYPFLKFTTVYKKFLKKISYKYGALSEFLGKFILNIVLKKSDENFIVLECYKKNKLYLFKPYIFLKREGFKIIKVKSDDPKLVERSYMFSLGPPYLSDGTKTVDLLLYDFFNMRY